MKTMTVDSELARIFGSDARVFVAQQKEVLALAKPVKPLRECTPVSWITTAQDCEDISHDCA